MTSKNGPNRREFLTLAAGGIAGLSMGGARRAWAASASAYTPGAPINPAIPNNRVVYIKDISMISNVNATSSFATQNAAVVTAKVKSNMDKMAMTLAAKSTAAEAWQTIFMKPPAKNWSDIKVFIKTNGTISTIMGHIAVVGKVIEELINLGVQGSNIVISDPGRGAFGNDKYTPYSVAPKVGTADGLPAGVRISTERYPQFDGDTNVQTWRTGGKTPNVPVTVNGVTSKVWCTKDLVVDDGEGGLTYVADMIINLAVNKGHPGKPQIADLTLSMKNHVGTFAVLAPNNDDCPGDAGFNGGRAGVDFFIGINTSEAVMGSGPTYPVRQHLILMDSLWASKAGPHINPDVAPGILAMGVAPGVVDWAVYKYIRAPSTAEGGMGVTIGSTALANLTKMCETFVAETNDVQWINAAVTGTGKSFTSEKSHSFSVTAENGSLGRASVVFQVSENDLNNAQAHVYDIEGRLVRTLGAVNRKSVMHWDGRNGSGAVVSAGKYMVKLVNGNMSYSKILTF